MSLYHFSVKQVSRGKGQTVVGSAAYISGQKLHNDYYEEIHDYTRKQGVIYDEIMLPDYVTDRFSDRQTLWNEVEFAEKGKRAQLAYSFNIALQNELTMEENVELAREFCREQFVSRGMIVDMAVHEGESSDPEIADNPHFHVLVPIRPMNPDGTWGKKQRREYKLDEDENRIRDENGKYIFSAVSTTGWNSPELLEEWRKQWADKVNAAFKEKGLAARIDHRSYEKQGIEEFYTISTKSGKIFYLIIDNSKSQDNVYFLTEVSEKDLMNFTLSDSVTLPEVDIVYAEPEKQAEEEKPETTETDEKDKVEDEIQMPEDKSLAGTYLLIGLVAVGAAAGGYYLKVYKPKHEYDDEDEMEEDENESEDSESEKREVDDADEQEESTEPEILRDEDFDDKVLEDEEEEQE